MTTKTGIEWTDATWNPVTGCSKVSPGCAHCYAEAVTRRFNANALPWTPENAAENVVLHPERLGDPLRWRKPKRVFVNSMSDLFHEQVPDEYIDRVFAVMSLCPGGAFRCAPRCGHESLNHCFEHGTPQPRHTFQILTKRPERMLAYLTDDETPQRIADAVQAVGWYEMPELVAQDAGWPLNNVWLGVSAENQHWADERIPLLLQTPAAVRFVSLEPLLGPVIAEDYLGRSALRDASGDPESGFEHGIDWVIVGAESGPNRRSFDLAWARTLRDQCRAAGVAYFGKQGSGLRPGVPLPGDLGDKEFPEELRTRAVRCR